MTQALYYHTKRPQNCTITQFLCVDMRRDKSPGGIHKPISVMLLSGGGGLAHDRSRHIHSQELLLLVLVLLATGILNDIYTYQDDKLLL